MYLIQFTFISYILCFFFDYILYCFYFFSTHLSLSLTHPISALHWLFILSLAVSMRGYAFFKWYTHALDLPHSLYYYKLERQQLLSIN